MLLKFLITDPKVDSVSSGPTTQPSNVDESVLIPSRLNFLARKFYRAIHRRGRELPRNTFIRQANINLEDISACRDQRNH